MKSISRDGTNDSFLTLDIGQVLINTIQLCEEKLKSQGVVLDSSGIKEQIFCSGQEISLGQVFLNLLNNSVDAIAEQSNQWIRISMHVKNGQVQITFVDSGSGISSAVAAKMFHPFYTTKDVGKGTGLGLSISRRIVENHGGQLYYDNHAKNTTMVVVLPINVGMYSKQI
jgi:C4-dicarboxylate-specific signal transduction histidine kinase